uniref:NADH-ubiquinone oxidoreductase chain 5 n=2 Tax=Phraortes TaxID=590989 RepID=E2RUR2_PHRIL|nr:NADH dehydrogenase subunit 5 [Phraortes illepidus]YP_010601345.1 NADH dehydrogenase subunit 5 [Phraortes lii]WAL35424.1 NADH dehydrogenase subunit 5 [Phraortes lii]BAJ24446.1 NADH dehydrogenase subunit 5 [Phraortes illepidus]
MLFNYSLCLLLFIYLFFVSIFLFLIGIYFCLIDLVVFIEYELFMFNSSQFIMTLLFDWMSLIFMSFVLFISSLVIKYSEEYMSGDPFLNRFVILILMFIFSMMFLILSPNMISILLGWDGLGLVSYCLVIYYQNVKSFNAGMITALSNRVGDCMILMSIAWMFSYGSWNYFMYIEFFGVDFDVNLMCLMILIAGMTKSAQIPFSPWLPAAMAAPTPVSSLVHSSTLVTAGVYLLIRFNPFYLNSSISLFFLFISLITMFMSGICANFEFDLKKIIALSTLSQLGLMMSIISFGYIYLGFFHLLTHAMFKALLFMCSGVVIHSFKNCQDIRLLGNIFNQLPLTCICFIISSLCLCGFPFLSGFYSKDLILDYYSSDIINLFMYFLLYFSTGLTVSYSFRLIYYLMIKDYSFFGYHSLVDNYYVMLRSMYMLLFLSIVVGCLLSWIIFPTPVYVNMPIFLKLMVLMVCLLGGFFGYFLSFFNLFDVIYSYFLYKFSYFIGNMWFIPYFTVSLPQYPMISGYSISKITDFGWFEYFGGQGIYSFLMYLSNFNQSIQSVMFYIFFLMFSFWFIILVFI